MLIVDHLLKLGMRPQVPFGGQEEGMELKRFEDASKPLECFEWSYNSEKLLLEKISKFLFMKKYPNNNSYFLFLFYIFTNKSPFFLLNKFSPINQNFLNPL